MNAKLIDLNVLQIMSIAITLVFNLFVGVNSTSSKIQLSIFLACLVIYFTWYFVCAYIDRIDHRQIMRTIHRCYLF